MTRWYHLDGHRVLAAVALGLTLYTLGTVGTDARRHAATERDNDAMGRRLERTTAEIERYAAPIRAAKAREVRWATR